MRLNVKKRMKFISDRLSIVGYINRIDISKEFEVSLPQCSKDLLLWQETNSKLNYNTSLKRYEINRPIGSAISKVPRRIQTNRMKPEELTILRSIRELDILPPDKRLTSAQNLLKSAKELLGDYFDEQVLKVKK